MNKDKLTLKIVSPQGLICEKNCDSIKFPISDDKNGEGSGSYGIRKGHIDGLFCLTKGKIEAFEGPDCCLSKELDGGFAEVKENVVTIVADKIN